MAVAMRDVLDFYKQRPVIGALVAVLGLLLAVAVATVGNGRPVLAVVFALLVGLLIGGAIAAAGRRG
jgi:uncharacterized membrane protein